MSWVDLWKSLRVTENGVPVKYEPLPPRTPAVYRNLRSEDPSAFIIEFLTCMDAGIVPVAGQGEARQEAQPVFAGSYGVFSSGTLSRSSLYFIDFKSALELARAHAKSLGITSSHTLVQTLPLSHAFGILAYVLTPLVTGCGLDLSRGLRGPREISVLDLKKTVCHLTPAHYPLWNRPGLSQAWSPDIISCGADFWNEDCLESLRSAHPGADLFVTYGLTQAGPRVTSRRWTGRSQEGDVGIPLEVVDVMLINDEGKVSPEAGELCVYSPALALNLPQESLIESKGKRYLRTRDRFRASQNGLLFQGRIDDALKVGGRLMEPWTLSDFCKTIAGVTDATYVVRKHSYLGSEIILCLCAEPASQERILLKISEAGIICAGVRVCFFDELPRNTMGKISHESLRELVGNKI